MADIRSFAPRIPYVQLAGLLVEFDVVEYLDNERLAPEAKLLEARLLIVDAEHRQITEHCEAVLAGEA